MIEEIETPTKVFISYSWDSEDHKNRVLTVANTLRDPWGIETDIDEYVRAKHPFTPLQGWDLWMEKRIEWAEFVLIVCTETYHRRFRGDEEPGIGRGSTWEGTIIRQHLYNNQLVNTKFIPVVFSSQDLKHVPIIFNGNDKYIFEDEKNFRNLCYRLRKKPVVAIPKVSAAKLKDPSEPQFFSPQKQPTEPPPVLLNVDKIQDQDVTRKEAEQRQLKELEEPIHRLSEPSTALASQDNCSLTSFNQSTTSSEITQSDIYGLPEKRKKTKTELAELDRQEKELKAEIVDRQEQLDTFKARIFDSNSDVDSDQTDSIETLRWLSEDKFPEKIAKRALKKYQEIEQKMQEDSSRLEDFYEEIRVLIGQIHDSVVTRDSIKTKGYKVLHSPDVPNSIDHSDVHVYALELVKSEIPPYISKEFQQDLSERIDYLKKRLSSVT